MPCTSVGCEEGVGGGRLTSIVCMLLGAPKELGAAAYTGSLRKPDTTALDRAYTSSCTGGRAAAQFDADTESGDEGLCDASCKPEVETRGCCCPGPRVETLASDELRTVTGGGGPMEDASEGWTVVAEPRAMDAAVGGGLGFMEAGSKPAMA
jgi:hypothetical protein